MLSELTVLIKTFNRPEILLQTCRVIREYHPDLCLQIIDDGNLPVSDLLKSQPNIEYLKLDKEVGLSEGRNIGISRIDTPYVLVIDDDVQPSSSATIPGLMRQHLLNQYHVTGAMQKRFNILDEIFHGTFEKKDSVLHMHHGQLLGFGANCHCNYVLNSFIGDTDFLKHHPWDPELKLLEHWDFFYRMYLDSCYTGISSGSLFIHYPILADAYKRKRFSSANDSYLKYSLAKHGLKTVIKHQPEAILQQRSYLMKTMIHTFRNMLRGNK